MVSPRLYDLFAFLARKLLSPESYWGSLFLDFGLKKPVEVALCGRTPTYAHLRTAIQEAKDLWHLSDAALAPYELRFVPSWFSVITSHEPFKEIDCLGVVAMDVREIRVSLRGDKKEEHYWERTLVHEFAHIYCHEHPEFAVGWDPHHKMKPVWELVDAYKPKDPGSSV